MKYRVFYILLCFIILCSLSACNQQIPDPPEYGYIPLSGLQWGMTKKEILDALHLRPDQLEEEDSSVSDSHIFTYLTPRMILFGKAPYGISFQMEKMEAVGLNDDFRLTNITIAFQGTGPDIFTALQSSISNQYGTSADQYYWLDYGNARKEGLQVKFGDIAEHVAFWYSQETLKTSFTPPADQFMREQYPESTAYLTEAENWEALTSHVPMTTIRLDCREEKIPSDIKSQLEEQGAGSEIEHMNAYSVTQLRRNRRLHGASAQRESPQQTQFKVGRQRSIKEIALKKRAWWIRSTKHAFYCYTMLRSIITAACALGSS